MWVIPRLRGQAKAAMAAVEYDEFGAGRGERVHAELFADLMTDLALDPTYNHYLDATSARMLAVVNMMSLLGLHRALRGALVRHFATVGSPPHPRRPTGWPRHCDGSVRARRRCSSPPNMWRPTPSTSRSYAMG
ncbi:hypothetical protein SANTM175S_02405 [Streptomyces antimycoticus]